MSTNIATPRLPQSDSSDGTNGRCSSPQRQPSGSEQDTSDDSSMEDEGLLAAQSSDDEASDSRSHIEILGMQSRAKCGYCGTPDGSRFFAIRSDRLACQDYQCLVDRGWRRSGSMLYLTDHSDACCAYYTIRTHALEHRLSPSDKKLMRKLRRYFACHADSKVAAGDTGDSEYISKIYSLDADKAGAGAPSSPSPLSLSPPSSSEPSHPKLKVRLESPAFSEAKYALFEKYQIAVHDDHKATRSGFRRFLCDSPLVPQQPQSTQEAKGAGGGPLPRGLGSYHQCYYIDGRLVAVGVLDILPRCVSSVYLFYDPEFSHLSLGSYSALREIALARELHRSIPEIAYYYMGYYIPSCPKMVYKGHWRPADLLDLVSLKWVPIERCLERISEHPTFCTFDPDVDHMSLVRDKAEDRLDIIPGMAQELLTESEKKRALRLVMLWPADPDTRPRSLRAQSMLRVPAAYLASCSEELEEIILQIYASLGDQLAHRVVLSF